MSLVFDEFKKNLLRCVKFIGGEERFSSDEDIIYCPLFDGKFVSYLNDRVLIPRVTCISISQAYDFIAAGRGGAEIYLSLFGFCDGRAVIEMTFDSYQEKVGSGISIDFHVRSPDVRESDFVIRIISISENHDDFIIKSISREFGDKADLGALVSCCISSISSGCSYSESLVDDVSALLRDEQDDVILVSLLELCGVARFQRTYEIVKKFLTDSRPHVRMACYFSVSESLGCQAIEIIKKHIFLEKNIENRSFLIKSYLLWGRSDHEFIHRIMLISDLSKKERRLLDAQVG